MVLEARTSLFLCGPPAVGKTTLGRLVAARLKIAFFDLDAAIESRTEMPVEEIWRTRGESHFRAQETAVLRDLVERNKAPLVVALGGGSLQSEANRDLVSVSGWLVCLRAESETLLARGASSRSIVAEQGLTRLLEERGPVYADVHLQLYNGKSLQDRATQTHIEDLGRLVCTAKPS